MNSRPRSPLLLLLLLLPAFGGLLGTISAGEPAPAPVYIPMTSGGRTLAVEPVGQNFMTVTAITHAGDERLFVVERNGIVRIIHPDGRQTVFLDLEARVVASPGELGMFDIAFHPGYADPASPGHGFFYVTYTGRDGEEMFTFISRFRVSPDPDVADPASEAWLMRLQQINIWHKGGELVFDPLDNSLYVGLGDDTRPLEAQGTDTPKGKIIRLAPDDVGPELTGDATPLVDYEIVARGFRNPWRFDIDPAGRRLFVGDVGEDTWEEVNVVSLDDPEQNFGWPCYEGADRYARFSTHPACAGDRDFLLPAAVLAHSGGHCSVIGGKFYRPPNSTVRRFLYADACSHGVFELSGGDGAWVSAFVIRLDVKSLYTTLGEDVFGNLYLGTVADSGPIYRLVWR